MNEVCKENQRHINSTNIAVYTFHFLYTYIFNYYVDVAFTAFVEHVI